MSEPSLIGFALGLKEAVVALCSRRCGLTRRALHRMGAAGATVVLTYHHIGPASGATPCIRALASAGMTMTPNSFARQMRLIAKHFAVISLKEFLAARSGALVLPRNPILLTFDDGFRDTMTYAAPILASHGFRGVFSLVGCQLARESLAPLFALYHHAGFRLPVGRSRSMRERKPSAASMALDEFGRLRRTVIWGGRNVAGLAQRLGISQAEEHEAVERLFIGPAEAAALANCGHEIAAHGWEHLMCSRLSRDEFRQDVRRTLKAIERAGCAPPAAFVHPYGTCDSFDGRAAEILYQEGFQCAFTSIEGVNDKMAPIFALRRVQADPVRDDVLLRRLTGARENRNSSRS